MLSQAYFGILSPTSLKRSAEAQCDDPIGSGAFEVKQWIHGQELILVRNPNYTSWPATALHKGPALVDEVDWKFLSDPTERYAALTTGEANLIYDIPTVDWTSAEASYQVTQYITPGKPVSLYMNTENGPFTRRPGAPGVRLRRRPRSRRADRVPRRDPLRGQPGGEPGHPRLRRLGRQRVSLRPGQGEPAAEPGRLDETRRGRLPDEGRQGARREARLPGRRPSSPTRARPCCRSCSSSGSRSAST